MTDPTSLWDFADPAGSEQRFRLAAEDAEGRDRLVLLTQVARALGLQERYDDAHALLDDLAAGDDEVATRIVLERGRLLRSAGSPRRLGRSSRPLSRARPAPGSRCCRIDALHMLALVAEGGEQLALTQQALALARASRDPLARDWDASLLNNLAMTHADAGDFDAALTGFEEALSCCERIGDAGRIRVARWMVGWALRNLGRTDEALDRPAGPQGRARGGRSRGPLRRRGAGPPRGLSWIRSGGRPDRC